MNRNDLIHVPDDFDLNNACNPEERVWKYPAGGENGDSAQANYCFLLIKYFDVDQQNLRMLGGAIVGCLGLFLSFRCFFAQVSFFMNA